MIYCCDLCIDLDMIVSYTIVSLFVGDSPYVCMFE